ncbi:MAG: class I adenylate-forming enzyme family protein [Bauldia sp.]
MAALRRLAAESTRKAPASVIGSPRVFFRYIRRKLPPDFHLPAGSDCAQMFTEQLRRATLRGPDRIALFDNDAAVSYAQLDRSVHRLAGAMLQSGIVPGDRVGLTLRNACHHLIAALALMRIGCAHVILATHDPRPVRAELAARCRLSCVVADQSSDAPDQVSLLVPDFDRVFADAGLDRTSLPSVENESVALLATSSGSTGRAKIVPLTQRQLYNQTLAANWPQSPQTLCCPISVQFYAGQRQHLQMLCLGHATVLWDRVKVSLVEAFSRHGVTVASLSSAQARGLVDEARNNSTGPLLPHVRMRLFGSLIGQTLREAIRETVTPNFEVIYGATECGLIAWAGPEAEQEGPGWLGRPQAGISVEVLDDDGRQLAPGETGTFRIRTPGMVDGYFDDDALTAKMFRNGWFYPGDVGRLTSDGLLFLDGRADDIMNLSGVKVSPAEIQAVAEAFPGVIDCVAFPLRSAVHGDVPLLAVAADSGMDVAALLKYCRDRLGIRAPRRILRLDRLPRNAAGKIDYRELQILVSTNS